MEPIGIKDYHQFVLVGYRGKDFTFDCSDGKLISIVEYMKWVNQYWLAEWKRLTTTE